MEGQRIYLPRVVGGGYGEFWRCRKRYRVVKGGKASKKSTTAALWFIYHLMKLPGSNLLVVRQVYRTHQDSTFAQLKWAIRRLGVDHLWGESKTPLELRYLPTGQRILFRGFDDVNKLASTTVDTGYLCWVWVEEAYELDREADFDRLDLSVPRGEVPAPLFKQTTVTFNPWNSGHWLKSKFFDRAREDVFTLTTTYRCNEFLDDIDRQVFEEMRLRRPRQYAVAGLGEWGVAEGLVFERWRVEAFDPARLGGKAEGVLHVFGLDYGYTNDPTAFIAAAVQPDKKRLYIYDEHYEKRMLNGEIAAMIRAKGYGKERIRADAAEPKSNEELRRLGIARLRAADKGPDSVRSGIARIQEYDMVVHPRCVHTIEELGAYCWEPPREGVPNRPADRDNHLMDALRYAMEEVRDFHPGRAALSRRPIAGGVLPEDLRGGWGGS